MKMQENQSDSSRFAKKINALRQRVLKIDGIEKVEGISEDICECQPATTVLKHIFSDNIANASQEQG